MGAPLDTYNQVKPILDDLARTIGRFDPDLITHDQRTLLHASAGPAVVILLALLLKRLTIAGVQVPVLTLADLQAAKALAYAEDWSSVIEQ